MSTWRTHYASRLATFADVAQLVRSGDFVCMGIALGAPSPEMYHAVLDRGEELEGVVVADVTPVRPCRLYDSESMARLDGRVNYHNFYGMPLSRPINATRLPDFRPLLGSDGGHKIAKVSDVFMCMVTPPDAHGYVNLGPSTFYTAPAIREGRAAGKLRLAVAEVNEQVPTVFGDAWMHVSEFDAFVEHSSPLPQIPRAAADEAELAISAHVLELINDGDTIQMGIGGIPDAIADGLKDKRDLGIHTELLPGSLQELVEQGVVTNANKPLHQRVTVAAFGFGDRAFYDYVDRNPGIELHPATYTNDPFLIARHPNFVAVNMALFADLTGQIASEGIGHRMVSGPGGQPDFMVGAFYSPGGRSVIVLRAARTLKDGSLVSAIVPELPPGTPVTVTRNYAHYVVTEYGIADLRDKSRRERADALIAIAHPAFREELASAKRANLCLQGSGSEPESARDKESPCP